MTMPTRLERKQAAKQALAILTVAVSEDRKDELLEELINGQGDMLPLVTASVAGLACGLLRSFDDLNEGVSHRWLAGLGRRIEAMPEGGA